MATGERDIVRRGYLSIVRNPKDGVLGSLTASVSSKRYWVVLRKETLGGGRSRLELYRNEDQVSEPVRQIFLNQVQEVQPAERRKAFEVHLPDDISLFLCSSKADMEDWARDVLRFCDARGSSSSSSFNGELPDNTNGQAVYEDIPNDESFRVRLRKSNSLMFSGPCLLEILRDFDRNIFHIAIFTEDEPPRLIVKWQIDHVRQYGSNRMAFKFQSGSKSPTGVDWFIMDTDPGAASRIHKSVDYWAKHIVDQVKNMTGRVSRDRSTSVGGSLPPRRVVSPTGSLPHSVYEPLNPVTMQGSTVYDSPDMPKPFFGKKPVHPNVVKYLQGKEKSATPTPSSSSRAMYQPLKPSKRANGGDSMYEDLNQRTREPEGAKGRGKNVPAPGLPGRSNAVYMDLTPQTRNSSDQSQYMGLKDARS